MEDFIVPIFDSEEDAKKKSEETLSKLLDKKLITLDSIKSLINLVNKKANQKSLEILNKTEQNITDLDISLKSIEKMIGQMGESSEKQHIFYENWNKISRPISSYGENLEKIIISKKNVNLIVHNLDIYLKIEDQIKEMRKLLKENPELHIVTIFKQVRYLTYLRTILIMKLKNQIRSDKLNNLADHLMCIQEFDEEFFTKFWSFFKDALNICQQKPEFIVKCLILIEEDKEYMIKIMRLFQSSDRRDKEDFQGLCLKGSFVGNSINMSRMNSVRDSDMRESKYHENVILNDDELKEMLKIKIEEGIVEDIAKRFKGLTDRDPILEESLKILSDLQIINEKVAPCFPPSYQIFSLYKAKYLNSIILKIKPFLDQKELEKTPGLLIPIARWLSDFEEGLKKIGININETDIVNDIKYCMMNFYDHVDGVLDDKLNAAINKNQEDKKALLNNKKLNLSNIRSYYATDIYSAIINVIDLLSGDFKGELMFQIIKQICDKIKNLIKQKRMGNI